MRAWPTHWYTQDGSRPLRPEEYLSRSHDIRVEAFLWNPATYMIGTKVPVLGGQVSLDATAATRGSCALEVPPVTADGLVLVPAEGDDAMAPFGSHVKVHYTYVYWGFYTFQVPLGVFRLSETEVTDEGTASVRVTGYDLSRSVQRNKLVDPWVIPAGVEYGDAIWSLVQGRSPYARKHPSYPEWPEPARAAVPNTIVLAPETDAWAEAQRMASAVGCEAYFDGDGYFRLRVQTDPATEAPVWSYTDGENAVLLGLTKRLSDDPGYNGVVMSAEATTLAAPIRAVAWDDDPRSPTYRLGPYGEVPDFQTNPYVTNQAMANQAARAALLKIIGGTEQVSIATVPNAAHEPGDVIALNRGPSRVSGAALIDKMTVPLSAGEPMSITARERRVLS